MVHFNSLLNEDINSFSLSDQHQEASRGQLIPSNLYDGNARDRLMKPVDHVWEFG
jgi:hypothetical protein